MSSADSAIEKTGDFRWIILVLMFSLQACSSMVVFSFGPLAPFLQDAFSITRAQVGMFSSAIYLGMFLFSTHAGWLTDRYGIRIFLILGPGVMGLIFITFVLIHSFIAAMFVILICGVGYQFINPTTVKALTLWFPAKLRGTVIGIKQAGISVGGAAAAVILPFMAEAWGWHSGVIFIGIMILLIVLLCFVFYKEPPVKSIQTKKRPISMKELSQTVTNRNVMLQSLVGIFYCGAAVTLFTYLVLYLNESLSMSVVTAGTCLMVSQLASAGGRVLWGVVSDRLFGGKRKETVIIMGCSITLMSLIAMLIHADTSTWLLYVIFALFGFTLGIHGVHVTFLAELGGKKMAATSVGFGAAISALGMFICPPIFGYIVDQTDSYTPAWLFLAFFSLTGIVLALFIKEEKTSL